MKEYLIGVVNEEASEPVIVNGETVEIIDSGISTKKQAEAAAREYRSIDKTQGINRKYVIWKKEEA